MSGENVFSPEIMGQSPVQNGERALADRRAEISEAVIEKACKTFKSVNKLTGTGFGLIVGANVISGLTDVNPFIAAAGVLAFEMAIYGKVESIVDDTLKNIEAGQRIRADKEYFDDAYQRRDALIAKRDAGEDLTSNEQRTLIDLIHTFRNSGQRGDRILNEQIKAEKERNG